MGLTPPSVFKGFDLTPELLVANASAVATFAGPPGPRRRKALGDVSLVKDAAVLCKDGKVAAIGPTAKMRQRFPQAELFDAEGGLVTPGFVDPHNHLPFAGNRAFELRLKLAGKSYEQILKAGGGIRHTVAATQKATRGDLVEIVKRRARTMLEWGTTTSEAKSGYGLEFRHEVKQLEAVKEASDPGGLELVPTFLGAHVLPEKPKGGRDAWVSHIADDMIPEVARRRLAEFADVFVERSAYTRDEGLTILLAAKKHGLGLKVHADEFTNQEGAELGAFLKGASCDHLLKVSRAGIQRLAASDTAAVLLPGVAALGFLEEQAPARKLVEAGAVVALGTDFNPNCPVLTMPTVLQWGVHQLRLTPEEALAACTVNAAHALGRGDRIGRLQQGYQADLLVHRVPSVEELAYWVGPNPVRAVVKRGRVVHRA